MKKYSFKNKLLLVSISFVLFLSGNVFANEDIIQKALSMINESNYSGAFLLLRSKQWEASITDSLRFEIYKLLAETNEKKVGNIKSTVKYYTDIVNSENSKSYSTYNFAKAQIDRILSLQVKYLKEDKFLEQVLRSSPSMMEVEAIEIQTEHLEKLVNDFPEYYRMPEVYYYLARNYTQLEDYGDAYSYYEKLLVLKPAIDFFLPVLSRKEIALANRNSKLAENFAWTVLPILLFISIILFYRALPWRWLNYKHVLVLLVAIVLWTIFYYASGYIIGGSSEFNDQIIREIFAAIPGYIKSTPGSPGSGILQVLYLYGVAGVVGIFIFVIGVLEFKNKLVKNLSVVVFGLLLSASLMSVFYLRYCDDVSKFHTTDNSVIKHLKGYNYFVLREQIPFVLTDPKSYPNLNMVHVDEPELVDWLLYHCDFDSTEDAHHH